MTSDAAKDTSTYEAAQRRGRGPGFGSDDEVGPVMTITSARPTISPTKRPRLARYAQQAFGWLFLLGSMSHVVFALGFTEIYRDFAVWSPSEWVRDAWASVFMPNATAFALLLAAFEATVGALILAGGRKMQLGLVGAIGFHIGLMLFGLWPWSVPMIAAFLALLVSDRRHSPQSMRPWASERSVTR